MFKLLVLTCLLVSCLAEPFGHPSWLSEARRRNRQPRGCGNRAEGWRACARLNDTDTLAPHGQDCSLFFYCSQSARPACRKCPAGLYFNPQLQVCDWPDNVDCTPRPPPPSRPPRPLPNGTTVDTTLAPEGSVTVGYDTTPDYQTDGPSTTISTIDEPSTITGSWLDYFPWVRK